MIEESGFITGKIRLVFYNSKLYWWYRFLSAEVKKNSFCRRSVATLTMRLQAVVFNVLLNLLGSLAKGFNYFNERHCKSDRVQS